MTVPLILFYPEGHQAHARPGHPERPERVEAIVAGLKAAGLWARAVRIDPLPLPEAVLTAIHRSAYLDALEAACAVGRSLDLDTYTTPASWDLALRAAGGAAAVARAVWRREARRGFALCRPPGHHATPDRGMGFCLLNNVALAAEFLLQEEGARRLAIVDLDLHHGNGTQEVFWRRGEVLFLSIHQSPLYPGTGRLEEVGEGPGEGTTANLPLPPGSGDRAYRAALESWLLPLLDRFAPQMLLVSAGFDPHWRDPLGQLLLSVDGYARLVAALAAWADAHAEGRIALVLEGGYDLEVARAWGPAVAQALLGEVWEDPLGPSPFRPFPPEGRLEGSRGSSGGKGHPEGGDWRGVLEKALRIWDL